MSQASELIAQQFLNGQVVPADLEGQNAVSKTYVDEQLAIRDQNISNVSSAATTAQADIDNHEASTTAHPAQNITYNGLVFGASNVKQGLDNLRNTVNQIIADGDSSAEVVDARGGFTVLSGRLNAVDTQLALTKSVNGLNVKYPPPPLVAAKANANYFNSVDQKWYEDAAFTVLSTDDTAAINAALSNRSHVVIPEGDYLINDTINIVKNGQKLIGSGIRSTKLISNTANKPIIKVNNGLNWINIEGMMLDRSVPATVGGNGLVCDGIYSNTYIRDLIIQNQFIGLYLGGTDWSEVRNVTVQYCYSDGFFMTNLSNMASCQWQMTDCLSSQNDGSGYAVRSVAGMLAMSMGKWTNINSFANSGTGISLFADPTCPINAFRILGGFLGADGNSEIYMSTYGGNHTIIDVFTEQSGTEVTGRTQTTPKTNVGSGIEITPNNLDVSISNCYGSAHSHNGVTASGQRVSISNSTFQACGQGGLGGYKNGIGIHGGYALISGNTLRYNEYGVRCVDGQLVTLMGNDLQDNTTGPLNCISNPTYIVSAANRPSSVGTVIPNGGLLVGAGATGGIPSAGEINVAGGIKKNNTAFVNP